jgi:hypothetical protein
MAAIHDLSVRSLCCEIRSNGKKIGSATSFIAKRNNTHFLVTNRHVVTGLHADKGTPLSGNGAVPDEILVWHNAKERLAMWRDIIYPLKDKDGKPTWLEYPKRDAQIDVVVLPISIRDNITFYPYDLNGADELDIDVRIGSELFVIGFPFGKAVDGKFPIWIRASLATEPVLNWEGQPRFLVDARTRQGQSGSPAVVVNTTGHYVDSNGNVVLGKLGDWKLLGIYSGRINSQSDLGIVWKRDLLEELLSNGVSPES